LGVAALSADHNGHLAHFKFKKKSVPNGHYTRPGSNSSQA